MDWSGFLGPVLVLLGVVWLYVARIGDAAETQTPVGALVVVALGAGLIAARFLGRLLRR
jgi:hypothetical protein